ncbi:MAG: glycosyltransferase family 4 protein [bacterium]|nr:glycosyltransferase family 4 protein [bacterium]
MLGRHPGWVPSPGESLTQLLRDEGYPTRSTSAFLNPLRRVPDVVRSLVAWRRQIDIVIVMVFSGRAFAMAELAGWLAKRLGKKLVLWLHGGNLPQLAERSPRWVRRVLDRGDEIVAPTTFLGNLATRVHCTVRIIPNFVRINEYDYRRRRSMRPRLLWMRTFHEIYQPQMAVRVLSSLCRNHAEATLTMAGQEKGLFEPTRRLAESLGLADTVRFPGFLDAAGKRRELARHDIFLNTNRIDNTPVSLVEAAAAGLPIVTTDVGGIPHLLRHGESALLVPDGDVEAMAHAVDRLLHAPELAQRLSDNGRLLAESCDWRPICERWRTLLDGLAA